MPGTQVDQLVLVVGGTGHYGQHIVRSLVAKGAAVRVLSRSAERARAVIGAVPEIVEGNITDETARAAAVDGVNAIVLAISAFNPKLIKKQRLIERESVVALLEQAQQAGVSRIVYISGYDVREEFVEEFDMPSGRIMLENQRTLAESDFNWTVLGAAPSMEIFFAMTKGEKMMVPGGGPPSFPSISPVDLGEIAAQAALRFDLDGRHIRCPGPDALSFPEAAARISEITGKPLRVVAIPLLPIRIAATVTRPFNPYIWQLLSTINLLNAFPQDMAASVPEDHANLRRIFDFAPTTLEMETKRRM